MPPIPPVPMLWHGMPPELNTARLMTGAGEAPMMQAAAGWEALAVALEAQAAELASALSALAGAWTGTANERAITAATPMVAWLQALAMQAQKRAAQATAQAASYAAAMVTTPPIPEIEENHITHAVLEGTNFLGVNAVPIGLNEADYLVRMWNQAAGAMDVYQAETMLNVLFEPIMPMTPIVIPGMGEAVTGAALGQAAAMAPGSLARELAITHASLQSSLESAALQGGRSVGMANMAATDAEGQASKARNLNPGTQQQQAPQQMMQQGVQMFSQVGSQVAQIPQQLGQMVQSPMQQLTQPLQQVTSMFSQMGGGHNGGAQMGLIGASPLSDHPLVGGSGASTGAGLVRAASLPGAGGSAPRTQLLAKLVDTAEQPVAPSAVAPGAAAGAAVAGGSAPVGAGAGGTGGAPMSMAGQGGQSGKGSKAGLKAPAPLTQDLGEDEADDW